MKKSSKYMFLIVCAVINVINANLTNEETRDLDMEIFVDNYISEIKRTLKLGTHDHNINKRSSPEIDLYRLQDIEILIGFDEKFMMPVKFPSDIILLSHNSEREKKSNLYAAALETIVKEDVQMSKGSNLILLKYEKNVWTAKDIVEVKNGVQLAMDLIGNSVYVIVAEFHAESGYGSTMFKVDTDKDILQYYDTLATQYPSDVIMWKWEEMEEFAVIAISENGLNSTSRYSTQSPVYRWLGSHFDVICTLPTYNPRSLTHFNIRSSSFIAVANFQNDDDETAVDSDIFRYNVDKEIFELYQKLPTEAAVDIKHFCFKNKYITEHFLVYASAFHKDEEGEKDYNSISIVYKLSDEEYFVPFQALKVHRITSWLPVSSSKDEQGTLILLALSDEGLTSFQYDGWKFVPTGVLSDSFAFGPGPKTVNIFYSGQFPLISIANKRSTGSDYNVFSPVLKPLTNIGNLQKSISRRMKRINEEMVASDGLISRLMLTASSAPTINDFELNFDTNFIFQNVEIFHLGTFSTKIGVDDNDENVSQQLHILNIELNQLYNVIEDLQKRINQLSYHSLPVYEDLKIPIAEITCPNKCEAINLDVSVINGEIMSDFLENIVIVNDAVEFDQPLEFYNLALTDPLKTNNINGHPIDSIIDWSKEVELMNSIKIEGDLLLYSNITVGGTIDDVAINSNIYHGPMKLSPSNNISTLHVSQLSLLDGIISQVNFSRFANCTLKTSGDQNITDFQDFDRLEADEVFANDGFFSAAKTQPPTICGDKLCNENEDPVLRERSPYDIDEAESIIEKEMSMEGDIIINGTIIIQNGSIAIGNLIDLKHNISARRVLDFAIPITQNEINNNLDFHDEFNADEITVDTINDMNWSSLIEENYEEPITISSPKTFFGDLYAVGDLNITGTVNGVDISKFLKENSAAEHFESHNLSTESINCNTIEINNEEFVKLVTFEDERKVFINNLHVQESMTADNIMLRGYINNIHLEKFIEDSVFKDGGSYYITGRKTFLNKLKIFNVTAESMNYIKISKISQETISRNLLTDARLLKVEKLFYKGALDGIDSREFGEWLLSEGDQTVTGSQTVDNFDADYVIVDHNSLINAVNFHKIISEAVLITQNITLDNVSFRKPIQASHIIAEGAINGLRIPEDIVLSVSDIPQDISGHKQFLGSVTIEGHLSTDRPVSDVDIVAYCQVLRLNNTKLVISGNASFSEEPTVHSSMNSIKWVDFMDSIWFKEDDIHITKPILMGNIEFENLDVETINNTNVEDKLSTLISKSKDQIVYGTFYFTEVSVLNDLEGREAEVAGNVQGLQLRPFIENVMLDGVDQEILGVIDFVSLDIEGVLENEGLVNDLNLSKDVMLTNVPSNSVTSDLEITNLIVQKLQVPPEAKVGGINLDKWNKTAVKKSKSNVITGDITFSGQFDSSNDIRIDGLLNGLSFEKNTLMLNEKSQQITGLKIFSKVSKLNIHNFNIEGYLNKLNISQFYDQQITASHNETIIGLKNFTSPLYAKRVLLPELYQGYDLTKLEKLRFSRLPWEEYYTQLEYITNMSEIANNSLLGQKYFLKNFTRVQEMHDHALYVFPLASGSSTAIVSIRDIRNKTTLSLLEWNSSTNMFEQGSVRNVLKMAPTTVQVAPMPSGEIAAYITSTSSKKSSVVHGEIFQLKNKKVVGKRIDNGPPGSSLLFFNDYNSRLCYIRTGDNCHVYCFNDTGKPYRIAKFSCLDIDQVTLITTEHAVYLFGLKTGITGELVVWKLVDDEFTPVASMSLFNPVSIASTSASGLHVAVSKRHIVGSSQPEDVSIYRFNEETLKLVEEHTLKSVSPKKVLFAVLPSDESVLYVISDNPASPLEIFVYRGVIGYERVVLDATLPIPMDIQAFTDHNKNHFFIVNSNSNKYVYQALF